MVRCALRGTGSSRAVLPGTLSVLLRVVARSIKFQLRTEAVWEAFIPLLVKLLAVEVDKVLHPLTAPILEHVKYRSLVRVVSDESLELVLQRSNPKWLGRDLVWEERSNVRKLIEG